MPRITFRDYLSPGARPWWEYVSAGAADIASGISKQHEDQQRAAEKDRQFKIEESRAQAQLLAESNRKTVLDLHEKQQDADRQAAVQGLQEIAGQKERDAAQNGIDQAIASPQGALGPFGVLSATAGAAVKGIAGVQADMGPKIELAKRMSPAGARAFLTQEAAGMKQETIADGYQREAHAVLAGVKDGVLTPEIAQGMVDALQGGLRAGHLPGAVHAQLAKAYDLHAKVQKRLAGWQEADRKAGENIASMEKMAKDATDPKTQQKLLELVGKAKGEWQRTQPESFRNTHDGEGSLAGLEQILFGAQAAEGDLPTAPIYGQRPESLWPKIGFAPGEAAGATAIQRSMTEPLQEQAPQAGPVTPPPSAPRGMVQQRPEAVQPSAKAQTGKAIQTLVLTHGSDLALASADSASRTTSVKKLLLQVAKETGLSVADPYLEGVVTDTIMRMQRGELRPIGPPAAPRALLNLSQHPTGLGPGGE